MPAGSASRSRTSSTARTSSSRRCQRGSKIPQMGFGVVSPAWGDLQVDQLRFMAGRDPDEVAYRNLDAGTAITFAEWDEQSNRLARFLVDQGVAKGDRVSIYLPADEALRWIVAYAATHKAGAVAVPTNTRLSVPELVTILGHAEVTACITCAPLLDNVLAVQRDVPSLRIVVSAGDARPWRHRRLRRGARRRRLRHPGADVDRRPRRHHVHVGHHGPAEGRRGPPPQRGDGPEPRAQLARRPAGSTARRCSRSPASRSSTTR